jgi:transglutaminase-like putative cysteine protease
MIEYIASRVGRYIRRFWVTGLMIFTLATMFIYSLEDAQWVLEESALTTAFLLGLAFGLLLARSRFPGWAALPYGLVISLAIAVESVGRIVPGPAALAVLTPFQVLEQMNLRIFNVFLRMQGWLQTLQAGENVDDPGLFVALISALLALAGMWWLWRLVRRRDALLGLLPLALLYSINVHLSRQPLTEYAIFLFAALLLVARMDFNRQHEEWQRRGVDYPDQLGLEWGGAVVVVALVLVLVARAAPLFGTPEGWRAISEWVNRANEETADTATRLFSGVNPPPPPPDAEKIIFVRTPNLASIGAPIPQGSETVMWVQTSDPPPPPQEIGLPYGVLAPARVHYWRSGIHATYNGRGWLPTAPGDPVDSPEALPEPPPAGRYFLRQDFRLNARAAGALFAVNEPLQASQGAGLRASGPGASVLLEGQAETYQVISAATDVTANQLAQAGQDFPQSILEPYLQLPDGLPERVRVLSARIAAGAGSAYEKTVRVQSYLRENYTYDPSAREAPAGRDAVDYFLFESSGGFCSHYASAMAVMLRAEGVPARVASGYAMGSWDSVEGAYRVPESASHAWVEVFFPGLGWVEFEPTVGRAEIVYAEEGPAVGAPAPVQLDAPPSPQASGWFVALLAVGALVLLALPFYLVHFYGAPRGGKAGSGALQAAGLYRQVRVALGWAGLRAGSSVTPEEYLAAHAKRLEGYKRLHNALARSTALYSALLYSPRPPDASDVRSARGLWRSAQREWLLLWGRERWQRLRAWFTSS